jgi:hypothetical protein
MKRAQLLNTYLAFSANARERFVVLWRIEHPLYGFRAQQQSFWIRLWSGQQLNSSILLNIASSERNRTCNYNDFHILQADSVYAKFKNADSNIAPFARMRFMP